ncbi:hypothetical protein [Zavarzinella formosa]|uniref:hypothetical protein n=1 Tax=Zavarzinella formosa TaxID=360055 RepID=UPI0002E4D96B|nr:hypothetical protein [Zavarzinella formosa]
MSDAIEGTRGAVVAAVVCETCVRLKNLIDTGEWVCPKCHGPDPVTAARLRTEYAVGKSVRRPVCEDLLSVSIFGGGAVVPVGG